MAENISGRMHTFWICCTCVDVPANYRESTNIASGNILAKKRIDSQG
jgi:hypothetical protein